MKDNINHILNTKTLSILVSYTVTALKAHSPKY